MKVAIYVRVSTDYKGQDPLNQLLQLRDFAAKQGWTVFCEYTAGRRGEARLRVSLVLVTGSPNARGNLCHASILAAAKRSRRQVQELHRPVLIA